MYSYLLKHSISNLSFLYFTLMKNIHIFVDKYFSIFFIAYLHLRIPIFCFSLSLYNNYVSIFMIIWNPSLEIWTVIRLKSVHIYIYLSMNFVSFIIFIIIFFYCLRLCYNTAYKCNNAWCLFHLCIHVLMYSDSHITSQN